MLYLFKGQLSYEEFTREIPYKHMIALKDARVAQLLEEKELQEKEDEKRKREMIRSSILQK